MRHGWVVLAALLLLGVPGCGSAEAVSSDPLLVAAASDLLPAFTELGESFEERTGRAVRFSFGSSGQLAQQIAAGAPFDVFASADAAFVDAVVAAGRGDTATQHTYASGRLVLWSASGRWAGWDGLPALAGDPAVGTIAIANPEHAPYGRAAREALDATGVLDAVGDRLVLGENVSDTQRLAATGNADAAVIALSLALAADERDPDEGRWVLIDEHLHAPLRQQLVVTAFDDERAGAAASFVELVGSEEGRRIMRRFGFLLPGEELSGDEFSGAVGP